MAALCKERLSSPLRVKTVTCAPCALLEVVGGATLDVLMEREARGA